MSRLFRTDDADAEVHSDSEGDNHGQEIDPAFSLEEVIQEGGCQDTLGVLQDVSAVALQYSWLLGNRLTVLMKCMKMDIASLTLVLEI